MDVVRVSNPLGSFLAGRAIPLGIIHEKEKEMGIAHLTEHLIVRKLQMLHRKEPIHFNGYTHYATTIFAAESVPERGELIINSLGKLEELEVDESLLERERKVVLSEIRKDIENPFIYLSILAHRSLFEGRLAFPGKGLEETVKSIGIEEVKRWIDKYNETEGFLLLYEGEENEDRQPVRIQVRFAHRNIKEEKKGLRGTYLAVVWTAENTPALFLLVHYLSNKVGLEVRKLGTYAPFFSFMLFPADRTPVLFRTRAPFPSEEVAKEAKGILEEEIEKIKEGIVDEGVFKRMISLLELEKRKTRYCKGIPSIWNDAFSITALGRPREELLKEAIKLGKEGLMEIAQSLDKSRTVMLTPSE